MIFYNKNSKQPSFFLEGVAIILLLLLCSACEPKMEDVIGATDDQELMDILLKSKDTGIQTAAFQKLSKPSSFQLIAVNPGVPEEFRCAAVDRVEDQDALFGLTKHQNSSEQVRLKAIRKISSEKVLAFIALDDSSLFSTRLKEAAVAAIDGQEHLFNIARNGNPPRIRSAAVARLSDQEYLFLLASLKGKTEIALAAVKKIAKEPDLIKLVNGNFDMAIRREALTHITNQQFLYDRALRSAGKNEVEINIAAVNNIENERMLVDIIRVTRIPAVGKAALEKITDQNSFFDIISSNSTSSRNDRIRLLVVDYLGDKDRLLRLLKKERLKKDLARALVAGITEQEMLLDLAQTAVDSDVRESAVLGIDDEMELVALLKAGPRHGAETFILKQITSQPALAEIINADLGNEIRLTAVEKLTAEEPVNSIAVNHLNPVIRKKLAWKVITADVLVSLARQDSCFSVRSAAVTQIFDQKVLAEIAVTDPSSAVRKAAVERVQDQAVLQAVAQKDSSAYVKAMAAKRISDTAISGAVKKRLPAWWDGANDLSSFSKIKGVSKRNDFIDIALNDSNEYHRRRAVEKVDDQDVLACVAVNDDSFTIRQSAVKRLDRMGVLVELAKYDESDYVRAEAAGKIKDQDVLLDLVQQESSDKVKKAALRSISDLDFVVRSAREEGSKYTQKVAYGRVLELMKLSIDCQSQATRRCHSCWYIGKLKLLLTEKAVRDHYGRLSLKVRAGSNSQKYTGGNTMYAQTLDLSVQNSKGKRIVQVSDNSYEFPYTTSSFAPICADADWRQIYNTILEPLAENVRVELEKTYGLNYLWDDLSY